MEVINMNLNCVNKWCKYQNTIYCHENCGSFMKENTTLGYIFHILQDKKIIAISDFSNNNLLVYGEPYNIVDKIKSI